MADVLLRCSTDGLLWARVQNGVLIVESRHLGERHVNVITIAELLRLVEEVEQAERAEAERAAQGKQDGADG